MVTWIVVAIVMAALAILVLAVAPLLGRRFGLRRAAMKLQRRRAQAGWLQQDATVLEETIAALKDRADRIQQQVAVLKAGRGDRRAPTHLDR